VKKHISNCRLLRFKLGGMTGKHILMEVFYSTQYDMYDRLKKDSYVIEKDLYVRIRWLRLILYDWFL
jgi:hypothetical protein